MENFSIETQGACDQQTLFEILIKAASSRDSIDNTAKILKNVSTASSFCMAIASGGVPYLSLGFHTLRFGIWVAWLTVIAAEMLLISKGLGFVIWDSYKAGDKIDLIEAIIDVAIIGALLDQLSS